MHPDNMRSREEVVWENLFQTNHAMVIKLKLEEKFPLYDFRIVGVKNSYRNLMTIQVASGLSDSEYHLICGYAQALHDSF